MSIQNWIPKASDFQNHGVSTVKCREKPDVNTARTNLTEIKSIAELIVKPEKTFIHHLYRNNLTFFMLLIITFVSNWQSITATSELTLEQNPKMNKTINGKSKNQSGNWPWITKKHFPCQNRGSRTQKSGSAVFYILSFTNAPQCDLPSTNAIIFVTVHRHSQPACHTTLCSVAIEPDVINLLWLTK